MDLCGFKNVIDNAKYVLLSADTCIGMPLNQKCLQLRDTLISLSKPLTYLEALHIDGFETKVHQENPEDSRLKRKKKPILNTTNQMWRVKEISNNILIYIRLL